MNPSRFPPAEAPGLVEPSYDELLAIGEGFVEITATTVSVLTDMAPSPRNVAQLTSTNGPARLPERWWIVRAIRVKVIAAVATPNAMTKGTATEARARSIAFPLIANSLNSLNISRDGLTVIRQ